MKKSQVLVPGQATKQTPLQLSEASSWCMYGQGFAPASSWQDFQQTLGQAKDRVTSAVLATVTRARRAARYVEFKLGNGTLSAQRHPRHASTVPAYSIKYLVTGRNASEFQTVMDVVGNSDLHGAGICNLAITAVKLWHGLLLTRMDVEAHAGGAAACAVEASVLPQPGVSLSGMAGYRTDAASTGTSSWGAACQAPLGHVLRVHAWCMDDALEQRMALTVHAGGILSTSMQASQAKGEHTVSWAYEVGLHAPIPSLVAAMQKMRTRCSKQSSLPLVHATAGASVAETWQHSQQRGSSSSSRADVRETSQSGAVVQLPAAASPWATYHALPSGALHLQQLEQPCMSRSSLGQPAAWRDGLEDMQQQSVWGDNGDAVVAGVGGVASFPGQSAWPHAGCMDGMVEMKLHALSTPGAAWQGRLTSMCVLRF